MAKAVKEFAQHAADMLDKTQYIVMERRSWERLMPSGGPTAEETMTTKPHDDSRESQTDPAVDSLVAPAAGEVEEYGVDRALILFDQSWAHTTCWTAGRDLAREVHRLRALLKARVAGPTPTEKQGRGTLPDAGVSHPSVVNPAEVADAKKFRTVMRMLNEPGAAEADALVEQNARRYEWLRARDLDTIDKGGVFAGMTPKNVVLNGDDLDAAIDAAMKESK